MKEKYRHLCNAENTIPIFSRDWWLDTVCGEDKWDVLLVEDKGRVLAAMPVYIPLPGVISMPDYTQTMGPWFAPEAEDTKYTTVLGHRQVLCKAFTDELKKNSVFLQNFNYQVTDWLPFYWAGFKQTTRYTYLLEDIGDKEIIREGMSVHTRRNINKAKEKHQVMVRKGIPADDFLAILDKTFQRQRKKNHQSSKTLKRLIDVCRQRGQGDLWGGYDASGNLHAAVFIVWQESSAYYLAGGGDPAYRDSGAHSLVLWEAMQYVSDKSKVFDFEGSMIPGVERFFREFGAIQKPFFTITKGKLSLLDRVRLKMKH